MRFFNNTQKHKGFTMIEVVVAVAIIALLASVVILSIQEIKKKSRDAQRYSDMSNIELALRLYKDSNGEYPTTNNEQRSVCTNGTDPTARDITGPNGYIPNLAPTYLPVLPVDPSNCNDSGSVHGYFYRSNGTDYKFAIDFAAEKGSECEPGKKFDDPYPGRDAGTGELWFCSIFSPGAANW